MFTGTVWLTGLPCSGKTTLGDEIAKKMRESGKTVIRLDGDVVRKGLCEGLGFTSEDRYENLRRDACVCEIINSQGVPVVASFISPEIVQRSLVCSIVPEIYIVHVACSAETCEKRDVKGMWAKAKQGYIRGFTGYDSCYEIPESPALVVDAENTSIEECVRKIIDKFDL